MLSKLIKHEFRATSRIMWPVFLGMLALTALMRFSQLLLNGGHIPWLLQLIGVLLVIGFMVGLGALAFAPLVLSAVRWRDHVLKDEGYLTLTLPVSLHQLLISKLIVSAVWYAAAFIVGVLSLLIAASDWASLRYVPENFVDFFTAFSQMDASLRGHALLILLELLGNFVMTISAASLVVYAAFSIGYSFNKHKELWTVILILVFFQLAQFTAIAMIGAGLFCFGISRDRGMLVVGALLAGFGYGLMQPLIYDKTAIIAPPRAATLALSFVMAVNYLAIMLCPFLIDTFTRLTALHGDRVPFLLNGMLTAGLALLAFRRRDDFTLGLDASYYKR